MAKWKKETYTLDIMREIAQGVTNAEYPTFSKWIDENPQKQQESRTGEEILDDFLNML